MKRPASITVFGILNFLFAALGAVGLIASVALFSPPANPNNSVLKLIHEGPAYAIWLKICIPLGLLSCAALLAAAIGLLGLKSWARTLSIAYAIFAIVFCLVAMLINLVLMVQPMFVQAPRQQELEAAGAIGGPISGTIGGLFWLIYPILLLIFMLHPKVVAAFRPPAPPQP
ncbi:MAG: hypothetical protein WBN22_09475 [Verrucomicrobiia bacterium]